MSLRTRLVLAFFALSVVPLAAVTFYSYNSNAEALRDLVRRIARGDHVARYGHARDCRGHWNGRRAS